MSPSLRPTGSKCIEDTKVSDSLSGIILIIMSGTSGLSGLADILGTLCMGCSVSPWEVMTTRTRSHSSSGLHNNPGGEKRFCCHLIDSKDSNRAKWSTCHFWTGFLGGCLHEGRGSWLGSGNSVTMETEGGVSQSGFCGRGAGVSKSRVTSAGLSLGLYSLGQGIRKFGVS